jgi:glycosyltransferase involved in cell wall biosynthesis
MRIVHAVRSDTVAGVERYVVDVAGGQARRGHHVAVVGGGPLVRTVLPSAVAWVPAVRTDQVLRGLARYRHADVVHAHMTAAEVAAVAAAAAGGPPVVATRHFAAPRGAGRARQGVLRTVVGPRLARQVSISHFVAASIGEPSVVIPNPVADDDAPPVAREPWVLSLARLEPEKDLPTALRGWARSHLPAAGWRLVLAGRGSLDRQLAGLASALGVADSVDWLGFVADPQPLLRRAAALVATAPAEPFGLAVVEGMASGTPVIAADAGAHPETLGPQGWFFGARDAVALAAHLDRLPTDPQHAHEYGRLLRHRQRRLFGVDGHLDRLDEVYRDVSRC